MVKELEMSHVLLQDETRSPGERAGGRGRPQHRSSKDSKVDERAEERGRGGSQLGVFTSGDPASHFPVPSSAGQGVCLTGTQITAVILFILLLH